jgi:hypothetical protein
MYIFTAEMCFLSESVILPSISNHDFSHLFFFRILERRRVRISPNQLQDIRELEFPVPSMHDLRPQNEEGEQVSVMNENMMKQLLIAVVSKGSKSVLIICFHIY